MRCMKWHGVFFGGVLSFGVFAHPYVDYYGVESKTGDHLVQKYSERITVIANSMVALSAQEQAGTINPDELKRLSLIKKQLVHEIKQDGDFAYVMLDTLVYAHPQLAYTTIEVVTKDDPIRLGFVEQLTDSGYKHQEESVKANDIFTQMEVFEAEVIRLFMLGELKNTTDEHLACPVYHCLASFDQPTLAPYLSLFNAAAVKDKALILDVLKNDPIVSRRGAAIFLVGHFNDPSEIIRVLLPYVNDPNALVRNNTLRTLSSALRISKIVDLDPSPFLNLLNSPFDTDRNKSLGVLLAMTASDSVTNWLCLHGEKLLLANLALKQPNNHLLAYRILQKISGQSFSPTAMEDWHNWFVKYAQKTQQAEIQHSRFSRIIHRSWQMLLLQYRQWRA